MNEIRKRLRARSAQELELSAFERSKETQQNVLAQTDVGPLTEEEMNAMICWASQLDHPHNYGFGWYALYGEVYDIGPIARKIKAKLIDMKRAREGTP